MIVPTRDERDNVAPLVRRLCAALRGADAEILFVDDSDDDTPDAVLDAARDAPMPVRLLHRSGSDRSGGLGGAVLAGIAATDATWVVVMDGDLQHPPEVVPRLTAMAQHDDLDVVVASRYRPGGAAVGLGSRYRGGVSVGASGAAKLAFPRRLAGVTDPMSGFFAVRREAVDPAALRPRGFKILLEILARTPGLHVGEVAFEFAAREHGVSKASLREAARFGLQLVDLRFAGTAGRLARFGLVGLSGFVVNLGLLGVLLAVPWETRWPAELREAASSVLAAQVAIFWNFLLTERWVFARQPRSRPLAARLLVFWALGSAALLLQIPGAAELSRLIGGRYLVATAIVLAVLVVARFAVHDRLIYTRRSDRLRVPAAAAAGVDA